MISTQFDEALESILSTHDFPQSEISQAIRYALFSGGKRLRPLLLLKTLESFGQPENLGLEAAISLEMIHTYSLIHDDLPAMDDDDFRRGQPTVHRAFSEGTAILAGDALLTLAFEVLAEAPYEDSSKIALIQVLAKSSGVMGMIGGQAMDLHYEGKECSLVDLEEMHALKTGALIAASLEFAAILLKMDRVLFHELGILLGLAFQIKNDLQDPKERNSDARKKKATFLSKTADPALHFNEKKIRIEQLIKTLKLHQTPFEELITKLIL